MIDMMDCPYMPAARVACNGICGLAHRKRRESEAMWTKKADGVVIMRMMLTVRATLTIVVSALNCSSSVRNALKGRQQESFTDR